MPPNHGNRHTRSAPWTPLSSAANAQAAAAAARQGHPMPDPPGESTEESDTCGEFLHSGNIVSYEECAIWNYVDVLIPIRVIGKRNR